MGSRSLPGRRHARVREWGGDSRARLPVADGSAGQSVATIGRRPVFGRQGACGGVKLVF